LKEFSDERLAEGLKQKSFECFEELVHRYGTPLYRFINHMVKDEGESQDLTQETFLRVYQHIERYDPQYPFKVWLYSIAGNLAINVLHSARRKRLLFFWNRLDQRGEYLLPSEDEIMDNHHNPEEALSDRQTHDRVRRAIDRLHPRQKMALTLNKIEGLSYQEIARTMNITLSAVESLIFRAKQRIHRELKEKERGNLF